MCFGKLILVGNETEQLKEPNTGCITMDDLKNEIEEAFRQRMEEIEKYYKFEEEHDLMKSDMINELKDFVRMAKSVIAQNSQLKTPAEQKF